MEKEMHEAQTLTGTPIALYDDEPVASGKAAHSEEGFLNCFLSKGGMASAVFNLSACMIGVSIVTLPAAFKYSGIVMGTLYLVICAIASVYSMNLLARVYMKTRLRSYEDMSRVILGPKMDHFTAFLIFVFCWGCAVAYVIAIGDIFKPLQTYLPSFYQGEWGLKLLVTTFWLVVLLPVSLPKEINSLRFASAFGVFTMVFFVLVIIYHAASYGMHTTSFSSLEYVSTSNKAILGMSLIMFSYCCQTNFYEVYSEMSVQTPKQITYASGISMSLCCLLNVAAGLFGYADFGTNVQGDVLDNFSPQGNVLVAMAFLCLIVKLFSSFALAIYPSRDSLFYAFKWGLYHDVSTEKRLILCTLLSMSSLLGGIFVPSLVVVCGLLGSLCGGMTGFVLPVLFFMYCGEIDNVSKTERISIWSLLVLGVVTIVLGSFASIASLF